MLVPSAHRMLGVCLHSLASLSAGPYKGIVSVTVYFYFCKFRLLEAAIYSEAISINIFIELLFAQLT